MGLTMIPNCQLQVFSTPGLNKSHRLIMNFPEHPQGVLRIFVLVTIGTIHIEQDGGLFLSSSFYATLPLAIESRINSFFVCEATCGKLTQKQHPSSSCSPSSTHSS